MTDTPEARLRAFCDARDACDYDDDEIDYIVGATAEEGVSLLHSDIRAVLDRLDTLVKAGEALKADMLERAECRFDVIRGEEYRVVNAGNGAWTDFCAALRGKEG